MGIPLGFATLSITAIMLSPKRYRRPLALRLTVLSLATVTALFGLDLAYTLGYLGVWQSNFWLDQADISRQHSVADSELGFVRKPWISWHGDPMNREAPSLVQQNRAYQEDRYVHYRTDENGFRNPPGLRRADIVFIGDSYTEGSQVAEEHTFVQRVAAASGLEAVNLGRGAYGPQQELIVLRRYGLKYRPRYVVWQLFEGNDLIDARGFTKWKENPAPETSLKYRYLERSLITRLLSGTVRGSSSPPPAQLTYLDGTVRPLFLRYGYHPDAPLKDPIGLAETQKAVEAGHQLCESLGIELLVLFIPTMLHVLEPFISFSEAPARDRYLPRADAYGTANFGESMAELCVKVGCSYVDMFPVLRAEAIKDNRDLYFPGDEHLGIRGHEVLARTVSQWISARIAPPSR